MSERFHYFSHIEHLPGGSLILKDPFQVPADEGSICRYGPRLHGEQTLDPDPRFQGVAAYHRLLPLEREQLPEAEPILKIRPWPHPLASHLHGLSRVRGARHSDALRDAWHDACTRLSGSPCTDACGPSSFRSAYDYA